MRFRTFLWNRSNLAPNNVQFSMSFTSIRGASPPLESPRSWAPLSIRCVGISMNYSPRRPSAPRRPTWGAAAVPPSSIIRGCRITVLSPWNTSPWCGFLPNIYWKPPTTRGLSPTILAVPGRGKYPRSHATNQNSWFGWPKWVSTRSPSRSRTTWQTPNWPRHQLNSQMCSILRHQGRQKRQK